MLTTDVKAVIYSHGKNEILVTIPSAKIGLLYRKDGASVKVDVLIDDAALPLLNNSEKRSEGSVSNEDSIVLMQYVGLKQCMDLFRLTLNSGSPDKQRKEGTEKLIEDTLTEEDLGEVCRKIDELSELEKKVQEVTHRLYGDVVKTLAKS